MRAVATPLPRARILPGSASHDSCSAIARIGVSGGPMRTLSKLLLLLVVFSLACGGTTSKGVYRTPVVERGACATILMPGQTMPVPDPGDEPGCPGGYASIAGGGVIDDSDKTTKTEPHPVVKVLTAPLAILLFPFKMLALGAEKLTSLTKNDEQPPLDPRLRQAVGAKTAAADPQAAHEREELGSLERELEQRGGKVASHTSGPALAGGAATATGPATPESQTPGGTPSSARLRIADELAALRSGGSPAPDAAAAVVAAPVVAAGALAAAMPAPASGAVGPAADRVLDRDGDGRPDGWIFLTNGQVSRERFDDNGDGVPDRTVWRDPVTGKEQRVEEDRNGDGRVDTVSEYKDGVLWRVRRDTNFDGIPDTWSFYRAGQLTREEEDPDGDGVRNTVRLYQNGRLSVEREDRDGDGRVDRVTRYDADERVVERDEDQDGDGLVDARSFYEAGRLVRRELVSETQGDAIQDDEDLSSAAWSAGEGGAKP